MLLVFAGVVVAAYLTLLHPGTSAGEGTAGVAATTTTTSAETEVLGVTITTEATQPAPETTTTAAPLAAPTCSVPAPSSATGTMAVRIAFPCPGGPTSPGFSWVTRRVPTTNRVLTATVGEMVRGPSQAEQQAGFRSYWSEETADAVTDIGLSGGTAFIDLEPMPAGVPDSPEAGVEWLSTVAGTVFQFDTIRSLELRIDGDCDAFWQSIGSTDCVRLDRTGWSRQLASWREATAGPPESRG